MTGLPYLDLTAPGFSTRSAEVFAARDQHWCARTPYGLAVLRHREVGMLLRDRRLRQGSRIWPRRHGMTGSFVDFWERSVIGQEGDRHRHLRRIATDALSRDFIAGLKPDFDRIAADQALAFDDSDEIEFMEAFAVPFAGKAIAKLIGLGADDWRGISQDASTLGLSMGVDCKAHEVAVNEACDRLRDLGRDLIARVRAGWDEDSYIARLVNGFSDDADDEALLDMIVISIFGGVDTTRAQLGLGVTLFLAHPAQYQYLRADLSLVPDAIEEFIRMRPTTTWSTREAVEAFSFNAQQFEAGETVHLFSHASAFEPNIRATPPFDIRAKRKAHFGFGGGVHHCLGNQVARSDMASALTAIARRVQRFWPAGEAEMLPETGNTSPVRLPLSFEIAQEM